MLAIKIIIIGMFIMVTISAFKKTHFQWSADGGIETGYLSFITIGLKNAYFRPFFILLLPIVGIFFNKKIGWLMIMSYLYFVVINGIYNLIQNGLPQEMEILLLISVVLLFVPFIIFMNIPKISNEIYQVSKAKLLSQNIIASLVGIIITLLISI